MAMRIVSGQSVTTSAQAPAAGAATATVSAIVKVNTPVRNNAGRVVLFGAANESPWSFSMTPGGGQILTIFMTPAGTFPYAAAQVVPGAVCHLMMTWTPGLQSFYFNGKLVSTTTQLGPLGTNTSPVCFGVTAYGNPDPNATGLDYEIEDACVASGYEATAADAVALRDRVKTPQQVFGANLAFWMPLANAPGSAVTTGGITPASAAIVSSVTGSPGYTPALSYTPPVTASPFVPSESLATLNFLFRKADGTPSSTGGPDQLGPVLNVVPSVSIDNGPVTPLPSSPAPLSFDNYLSFQLNPPLVSGSLLRVFTPDAWAGTADGDAAGMNGVAANVVPVNPDDGTVPVMALGWNSPPANLEAPSPPFSNTFRHGSWAGWGTPYQFTADADDNLTSLSGSVICQVAGQSLPNGTTKQGCPTPAGVWTVKWKASTLSSFQFLDPNMVATVTEVRGSEVLSPAGNVRKYNVAPGASQYFAALYVLATQAGGVCDLRDVEVYPPAEPSAGSAKFSVALRRQAGSPACARSLDMVQTNGNNLTSYSQWPRPSKVFPSSPPTPKSVQLVSASPYSNPWFGPITCVMQFTTRVPHPFATGHNVVFSGPSMNGLKFADGRYYALDGLNSAVLSTGPTTFAAFCAAATTVSGVQALSEANASVSIKTPVAVADVNSFADWLGGDSWLNVPALLGDTEVRLMAVDALASLPEGRSQYVEWANETWNQKVAFPQSFYTIGQAAVAGMDPAAWHAMRSSQVHDVFFEVFDEAGRAGDLVRVVCSQWGDVDRTRAIAAWFSANNKTFDLLAIAPYFDNGPVAPQFVPWWAAATEDQLHDAAALFVNHGNNYTRALANHLAACASVPGVRAGCYEFAVENGCPAGAGYDAKSRAFSQHPRNAALVRRNLVLQQKQGGVVTLMYGQGVAFGADQNNLFSDCYNTYYGPDTTAGDSVSGYDNRTGFDLSRNVSVVGYAVNRWTSETRAGRATVRNPWDKTYVKIGT